MNVTQMYPKVDVFIIVKRRATGLCSAGFSSRALNYENLLSMQFPIWRWGLGGRITSRQRYEYIYRRLNPRLEINIIETSKDRDPSGLLQDSDSAIPDTHCDSVLTP